MGWMGGRDPVPGISLAFFFFVFLLFLILVDDLS
jgi:hypothetical protein